MSSMQTWAWMRFLTIICFLKRWEVESLKLLEEEDETAEEREIADTMLPPAREEGRAW